MTQQEKKYFVASFDFILDFFAQKNILPTPASTTHHFYGQQSGNDVTKLVQYTDRQEIHVLKESEGIFSLVEKISVDSVAAGLEWLKSHGFQNIDEIKMQSQNFEYRGGLVRLYLIDDWLHSIILSHPTEQLSEIEIELKLDAQQVIAEPYNKYLAAVGKLKSKKL